jgi:hypothetical protein
MGPCTKIWALADLFLLGENDMAIWKSVAIILMSGCVSFAAGTGARGARQDPQQDDRRDSPDSARPQSDDRRQSDDERRKDERRDDDRRADDRRDSDARNADREMVTLPSDTMISVRIADDVTTGKNKTGDIFTGTVDPSVMVHDRVVIPRGTEAHVRMAEGKKGGHIHGKAEIQLELVSLVVNGRRLGVDTDVHQKSQGSLSAKAQAERKEGMSGGGGPGGAGTMGATSMAGPVIAAFAAPKAEIKANTRLEFTLASPFTFAKPPINGDEQH